MNWSVLDFRYKLKNEIPEITEPPCKRCKHFRPRVLTDEKGSFKGIVVCKSEHMYQDFSCFQNKEVTVL